LLEDIQTNLRSFYSVLKKNDMYIEFLFSTGVSKFGNMTLFSDLNSPIDLTLDADFAGVCGYTHEELLFYFKDHIKNLADKLNKTCDEVLNLIGYWYDGYSWNGKTNLYAPYSTLELFFFKEFKNYWFKTATPKSLIDVFRNSKSYDEVLKPTIVNESRFDDFKFEDIDPLSFAFQTGYLTITKKEKINNILHYTLESPNFEVESSMLDHLLNLDIELMDLDNLKHKILKAIKNKDNENFQKYIKKFLTNIPARIHLNYEFYYQSICIAWFNGLGFKSEGEIQTNKGQMDIVFKHDDLIAIVECKFSKINKKTKKPIKSFENMLTTAFKQIETNKYYEKFPDDEIVKIAVAFTGKEVKTKIFS
jgi:hypothetical protein